MFGATFLKGCLFGATFLKGCMFGATFLKGWLLASLVNQDSLGDFLHDFIFAL
jgi:hypothetical protein